jgi:copper ion binding protein
MIVLLFATGLLACQPGAKKSQETGTVPEKELVEITFKVEGMTCDHCEMSIQKGVGELPGIQSVLANHEDSTTVVRFDKLQANEDEIKKAIERRGYIVKSRI